MKNFMRVAENAIIISSTYYIGLPRQNESLLKVFINTQCLLLLIAVKFPDRFCSGLQVEVIFQNTAIVFSN